MGIVVWCVVVWCVVWIVRGTDLVARQPRAAQHIDIQEGLLHLERARSVAARERERAGSTRQ